MKKLLFLYFVLLCVLASAQYAPPPGFCLPFGVTTVDSAYFETTYRLLSVKDPNKVEQTTFEDIQVLQVGFVVSKFYSRYLADHFEKSEQKAKAGSRALERNPYRGSYAYEVFRNYPTPDVIFVDELGDFIEPVKYCYEESQPKMEWQWALQPKPDTVLGYVCQKATTRFRGRDYTAWFALELPIPLGPWKFGGLPGLILRLEDSLKHYRWTAIGIERLKKKEPIQFRSGIKFTKVSRADWDKLYRRYHKDRAAFIVASGGRMYKMSENGANMKQITHSEELPYNPIELE